MAVTVERLSAVIDADPASAIAALQALDMAADNAAQDRDATITIHTDRSQVDQLADAMRSAGDAGDRGGAGVRNFGSGAQSASYHSSNLRAILMGGLGLPAIYGLATGAAGALQMLGAAAAGAASSLGSLAGIMGALPVGLGAVVSGLGATVMGFNGIGGAIKAANVVMGASPLSTGQAANSMRAVENAARGVENAYRSLARAQEQVGKAEKNLARARRDAAQQIADAEENAAQRIADARAWAAESGERLEDAQFAHASALIGEKEAVLALEAAQKRLAGVQSRVAGTSAEMSKVTDDFTGKVYEIARVSGTAADEQEDQRRAVLDLERAQLGLAMAQDRVEDSQKALNRARKDHDNTPAMLAKEEERIMRDLAKAHESAARSVESAQEGLANAHRGVEDAMRGVEDAQRSLADAQAAGATAAAGGAAALNKYNEAMAALTPEGRRFVDFMVKEFMPAWKTLQDSAQRGLLPGVERGLRSFMTMFPMLRVEIYRTAKTVGDHFAEFFDFAAETENVNRLRSAFILFDEVLGGSIMGGEQKKGLLDAFIPLYDIILSIIEAAGPMTKLLTHDIVTGLDNIAAKLNTDEGLGKLQDWFDRGYYFGGLFMDVLRPLGTVIGDVSEAARPLAEWMLKSMADYFGDLADVTSSIEGQTGMKKWFEDLKPAIEETSGLLLDLLEVIFGQDTDPDESAFLKLVRGMREDMVPALDDLVASLSKSDIPTSLTEFFANVIDLVGQIVEHDGAIKMALDFINGIADGFRQLDEATDGKSTDIILGFLAGLAGIKIAKTLGKITGLTDGFNLLKGAIEGSTTALGKELPWDKKKEKALGGVGVAGQVAGDGVSVFTRTVDDSTKSQKKATNPLKRFARGLGAFATGGLFFTDASRARGSSRRQRRQTRRAIRRGIASPITAGATAASTVAGGGSRRERRQARRAARSAAGRHRAPGGFRGRVGAWVAQPEAGRAPMPARAGQHRVPRVPAAPRAGRAGGIASALSWFIPMPGGRGGGNKVGGAAAKGGKGLVAKFVGGFKKGISMLFLPFLKGLGKILIRFLGPVGLGIGLVLLAKFVWEHWDKIKEYTRIAWDWIKEKLGQVWNWMKETAPIVWQWIKDEAKETWDWLMYAAPIVWDWIKEKMAQFGAWVKENAPLWWAVIKEKAEVLRLWIREKLGDLWDWLKKKTGEAWDWIGVKIGEAKDWIAGKIEDLRLWIRGKIADAWDYVWGKTRDAWDWIMGKIGDAWTWIKTKVKDSIEWVKNKMNDIWEKIKESARKAWNFVRNKAYEAWESMKNKIKDFLTYVGGLKDSITEKAKGAFDGIKEAFKDAFNWIIRKWNDFGLTMPEIKVAGKTFGGFSWSTPNIAEFRQFGGPVEEGKPYIVGEKRPEMFIPSTNGRIAAAVPRNMPTGQGPLFTEKQIDRLIKAIEEMERGEVNMENNFNTEVNPDQIVRKIVRGVRS